MKKLIHLIFLITSLLLTSTSFAAPNFEATRNFIMSKFNKYKDSFTSERNYGDKRLYSATLSVGECKVYSGWKERVDFNKGNSKKDELTYSAPSSAFTSISSWKRVGVKPERYILVFDMKEKLVRHDNEGEYTDGNDWDRTSYRDYFRIYFNYPGGERELESRLMKAFINLGNLAMQNPKCQGDKEAF